MKRLLTLILVVFLIVSMSSCHYSKSGDILEPVDYYYPRKTDAFIYGDAAGVITAEVREASGHIGDLKYLLTMVFIYCFTVFTIEAFQFFNFRLLILRTIFSTMFTLIIIYAIDSLSFKRS